MQCNKIKPFGLKTHVLTGFVSSPSHTLSNLGGIRTPQYEISLPRFPHLTCISHGPFISTGTARTSHKSLIPSAANALEHDLPVTERAFTPEHKNLLPFLPLQSNLFKHA